MCSTVTDYSHFTNLDANIMFAPSPVLRTPSPNRERENEMFASLEQKEKLFEDDSVSRAGACPENDFSFMVTINPSPYPSPSRGEGIVSLCAAL